MGVVSMGGGSSGANGRVGGHGGNNVGRGRSRARWLRTRRKCFSPSNTAGNSATNLQQTILFVPYAARVLAAVDDPSP
jgi:hypothetical protein